MGESLTGVQYAKGQIGMKSIKGPAIFLAQFAGDAAPFNTFDSICGWAASLGYRGVQIPAWDSRFIEIEEHTSELQSP